MVSVILKSLKIKQSHRFLIVVILFPALQQSLDITPHILFTKIIKYGPYCSTNNCSGRDPPSSERAEGGYRQTGHLKNSRGVLREAVRLTYALIRDNTCCWSIRQLYRVLDVHPIGFYSSLQQPHSQRPQVNLKLTAQIMQFWLELGCVYGARNIKLDQRDSEQQCGVNRVWRLIKRAGIKVNVGYPSPRAPNYRVAKQSLVRVQSGCTG